ncbi:peptide-methionine (S)-S-oxide reductase [Gillisia marina]|uniref:peptide-methionine (S)-S-oxide reductase n=1 Tax=Gillisia marina TaxID=1167637 RepID=UPI0002DCBA34|nr:peptide-methionine (S)-S-oxide reductase [Gillisia marina]
MPYFIILEIKKNDAEEIIRKLESENVFSDPIVTEITKASAFYEAEAEHKEYYSKHRQQQYCQVIIDPKIKKLQQLFADKVKKTKI